jgi:hypothetical protein
MLCYRWSASNIPNSDVSEYSTTKTFNSGVGKYYMKKKHDIPNFDVTEY